MTATIAPGGTAPAMRPVPVSSCYRFELVKLLSQWRIRLLIAACWIRSCRGTACSTHRSSQAWC